MSMHLHMCVLSASLGLEVEYERIGEWNYTYVYVPVPMLAQVYCGTWILSLRRKAELLCKSTSLPPLPCRLPLHNLLGAARCRWQLRCIAFAALGCMRPVRA